MPKISKIKSPDGTVYDITDEKVLQEYDDNIVGKMQFLFAGSNSTSNYTGQTYRSGNITGEIGTGTLFLKDGSKELELAPDDIRISGAGNSWDADDNQSLKDALAAKQPYISNANRWKIASNEEAVSAASGTHTTLTNITLTPGLWMIKYRTTFPNNSSGYRRIYLAGSASSSSYLGESRVTVAAANGAVTDVIGLDFFLLTESTDFYLRALQNSGSSMSLNGSIRCIRVS